MLVHGQQLHMPSGRLAAGPGLRAAGHFAQSPRPSECWGGERTASLRLAGQELVKSAHRAAMYKGCDVRLATGILQRPGLWPRKPFPSNCWRWKVVVAYKRQGAHINVPEMHALCAAVRWRLRQPGALNSRFLHLVDSQVCMTVLVKGRASSDQLREPLRRCCALLLASSCAVVLAYVATDDNPADEPSRRWQ